MANISWPAPFPFRSALLDRYQDVDVVELNSSPQGQRMQRMLTKLCYLGYGSSFNAKSLINEGDIWEGLNAFNMSLPDASQLCWTYVNQHILNVPSTLLGPIDWATWEPNAHKVNSLLRNQLQLDLAEEWTSVTNKPARNHHEARYRWVIFMHRHNAPSRKYSLNSTTSYSCTVWDRENETAVWYDCWPYDCEQREADIRQYWLNIPLMWPEKVTSALRNISSYQTITGFREIETGAHHHFPAAYSQYTMINVILWFMRGVNMPTGTPAAPEILYPPNNVLTATGTSQAGIPMLIVVLLLTLRSNPEFRPMLCGHSAEVQFRVREAFFIGNRNLKEIVRPVLTAAVAGTADEWLVRQMLDLNQ